MSTRLLCMRGTPRKLQINHTYNKIFLKHLNIYIILISFKIILTISSPWCVVWVFPCFSTCCHYNNNNNNKNFIQQSTINLTFNKSTINQIKKEIYNVESTIRKKSQMRPVNWFQCLSTKQLISNVSRRTLLICLPPLRMVVLQRKKFEQDLIDVVRKQKSTWTIRMRMEVSKKIIGKLVDCWLIFFCCRRRLGFLLSLNKHCFLFRLCSCTIFFSVQYKMQE